MVTFDLDKRTVTFSIGDFPPAIQDGLQSCLDINGFLQPGTAEVKFREIAAENLPKLPGITPELAQK